MKEELFALGLIIILIYGIWCIFNEIIFPKLVKKGTTEIERNPKWITSELQYYGFSDIDIITCKSKYGMLPRFKLGKNNKLELWIDRDIPARNVEDIGQAALVGKLKIKYNLWFPEKPIYWLSILLYMLDGNDINVRDALPEDKEKQETS